MAKTLIHCLSTVEKFLLSSTKFWPSLSTATAVAAVSSFCSTQQHTDRFNDSGKYIFSAIIALHFILFFFNPQNLKNTFAPFFHGSAQKWSLRITAVRFSILLHSVPDRSVFGLIFVICVWIDAIAISRIIKPSIDLWIIHSMFTAIVGRSIDLYGFTARHWLIMLFCFPVGYMQIRLEGYENEEETQKKEE
ncbi:hypothetical protein L6452_42326 [Arctium lappa]|uniref:Uncharacterized protein n=1 Tax=Arctium lappa TaxID=4217 RepID=A0ACB8XM13_ARCLA|nr:hypothetical protein L6452_42326 [Arctium lappa]